MVLICYCARLLTPWDSGARNLCFCTAFWYEIYECAKMYTYMCLSVLLCETMKTFICLEIVCDVYVERCPLEPSNEACGIAQPPNLTS